MRTNYIWFLIRKTHMNKILLMRTNYIRLLMRKFSEIKVSAEAQNLFYRSARAEDIYKQKFCSATHLF